MSNQELKEAANFIQAASDSFHISYKLDGIFDRIRKEFYNNVKLYNDKIAPFSEITIKNVQVFCEEILHGKERNILIKNAKSGEKLCYYAALFQKEILVNFKIIEDKLISSILELNSEQDEIMSVEVVSVAISNIRLSKSSETNGLSEPLRGSISKYCAFLTIIAGLFSNVHGRVEALRDKIDQAHEYEYGENDAANNRIYNFTKDVNEICSDYLDMCQKYQIVFSDIIYYEHDKYYIDWWIPNVITKNNKYEDFKSLLTEKKNLKLNKICGLLK